MADSTLKQITFDEWAIDVTFAKQNGDIAFVPICGDDVVRELTMIRDRAALGVARHNEGITSLLPCSARRSSAAPIVMAATSKP